MADSSSPMPTTSESTSPPNPHKSTVFERVQSTGNKWTDLQLAVKKISIYEDLKNIGEVPCARNSLLAGILSGTGMAFVRGWNAGIFVASNWAVGTFAVVSIGVWNVCRSSYERERQDVRVTIEKLAQRRVKAKPTHETEAENGQTEDKP